MTTKSFGAALKTNEDYMQELHDLVGQIFPITMTVNTATGQVQQFSYETEWKEGGTTAVEKTDDNGSTILDEQDNPVIDYIENYTKKKLTAAQIKLVDQWASENIKS